VALGLRALLTRREGGDYPSMKPLFEWDTAKAAANVAKHGVDFAEARSVFADPLALFAPDPDHSGREDRFVVTGLSHYDRVLVVVFTERASTTRIISARAATRGERRSYEEGR